MFPARLSIVTYNLWNVQRWPEREPALRRFVTTFLPDILCVQELRKETQESLDRMLPQHARVHDSFPGWTVQGNIYWNALHLEEVEHGAEEIGIEEEYRRLFWVRLRLRSSDAAGASGPASAPERTIFAGTAHLTHRGHKREIEEERSLRIGQTRRAIEALGRVVRDGEPAFFTGDWNDPYHPAKMMREAGWPNCFGELGLLAPPTSPSITATTKPSGWGLPSETIDWIVSNGKARAIAALVPQCHEDGMSPSDHWPVLAVYE
ncbi:MAG: endonuclease/exonuclease/phosphatase family protein, partial [Candidatus Eisenbacteria bacterium]|nr:endonuclease/exonuclease/phosphatase family protein [Candidatus Eisenbacteria bacterium]